MALPSPTATSQNNTLNSLNLFHAEYWTSTNITSVMKVDLQYLKLIYLNKYKYLNHFLQNVSRHLNFFFLKAVEKVEFWHRQKIKKETGMTKSTVPFSCHTSRHLIFKAQNLELLTLTAGLKLLFLSCLFTFSRGFSPAFKLDFYWRLKNNKASWCMTNGLLLPISVNSSVMMSTFSRIVFQEVRDTYYHTQGNKAVNRTSLVCIFLIYWGKMNLYL